MIPQRFGFALDGNSSSVNLGDPVFHATFIRDLAEAAGMRLLDLSVKDVEGEVPQGERWVDEGGISSIGLISTSHVCLHTWPKDRFFMLDVVSCRPFDVEQVKAFVMLRLNVTAVKRYQVTADDDGDAVLQDLAASGARPAGRAAPTPPG